MKSSRIAGSASPCYDHAAKGDLCETGADFSDEVTLKRRASEGIGMSGKTERSSSSPAIPTPLWPSAIADYLKTPMTKAVVRRFADMEIFVEIQENVRGADVFVIQSTSFPANDHLMELLIIIDALRRSSARRITAVIPYFGYARQDRKPAAHADLGQAGRQPGHPCRRRPCA